MFAPEINTVLILGQLDSEPFSRRQLQAREQIPELPSSTRAVIFVAGDLVQDANRAALVRWARTNARKALDHGALCLVAALPQQQNLASQTLGVSEETQRTQVTSNDPEAVAQACLRWNPGPFPKQSLTIKCADSLDADTTLLLKRAFYDFDEIELEPLTGGRSAITGIWRVEARSNDRELRSPFVAKCGPRQSIDKQVNTYRDVVADRVPYRGCAPLCLDRSAAGFSKRLSVSRFVEDAHRLDDLVIDPACKNVDDLIAAIYSGPLRRWRSVIARRQVRLVWQFLPRDVVKRFGPGVTAARRRLKTKKIETPSLSAVINSLKSIPIMDVPVCRAHDDLNFRNVFVARGGNEIILIDFTRAIEKPLSMDVARMDVGFAFDDELNAKQPISDDILLEYFTGDLFAISLPHVVSGKGARSRLAAIEALRRHILAESDEHGYDPRVEYQVAVISGLLYEAKRNTPWSSVAYRCASQLALSLPH